MMDINNDNMSKESSRDSWGDVTETFTDGVRANCGSATPIPGKENEVYCRTYQKKVTACGGCRNYYFGGFEEVP